MSIWDKFFPYRSNRDQQKEDQNQQKQTNAFQPLSQDFFRRGSIKALQNIALDKEQGEEDLLSGYLFAALDLRKTVFAEFCEENIITTIKKDHSFETIHPYLKLIEESKTSTEFEFWNDIMTDWDMKGEFYLFLLRRVVYKKEKDKDGNYVLEHLGKPVSIEVLDANTVKPLYRKNLKGVEILVGYEQWVDGSHRRVFAPEQIIHVRNKNPFHKNKAYSIFDIAKNYQYTMNKSSEFTTSAIVNNTNTPGILSTDQVLNDQEYDNLVAQINGHEAGKLIFTDGSGKLNYTAISQELDRSALPDVADVNRQVIFAVTGTSKTMLGIEESGTTRDTSQVQTEKFLQRVIRPMAKRVVSALNFDYRLRYQEQYEKDPIDLVLKGTVDPETAEKTYKTQKLLFDSVTEMTYAGYTAESAEEFLKGNILYVDLEKEEQDPADPFSDNYEPPVDPNEGNEPDDGGDTSEEAPENDVEETETEVEMKAKPLTLEDIAERKARIDQLEAAATAIEAKEQKLEEHNHHHEESLESWIDNKLLKGYRNENGMSEFGQLQSSKLKGIYKNLLKDTRKIQLAAVKDMKVNRNSKVSDLRTEKQEQALINELYDTFRAAMLKVAPVVSAERKEQDKKDWNLTGNVNILGDKEFKKDIDSLAMKCAKSHAETIYNTVLTSIQRVEKRKNSINLSEEELSAAVKRAYQTISNTRANVVAEDVFMRAVNEGRYYTDYLLLEINGKLTVAYKTLENDYPDPCPFCDFMIGQPMRPFKEDFIQWKEDLMIPGANDEKVSYSNNFAAVKAGDLHPGCRCMYALVLKETDTKTE